MSSTIKRAAEKIFYIKYSNLKFRAFMAHAKNPYFQALARLWGATGSGHNMLCYLGRGLSPLCDWAARPGRPTRRRFAGSANIWSDSAIGMNLCSAVLP